MISTAVATAGWVGVGSSGDYATFNFPPHSRHDQASKHPKVKDWLADHPRWVFHFTPTSASWINAVEGIFSALTRRRLKRGVFKSVSHLQQAIQQYLREHNADPKPFVWTKPAGAVLDKLNRLPEPLV